MFFLLSPFYWLLVRRARRACRAMPHLSVLLARMAHAPEVPEDFWIGPRSVLRIESLFSENCPRLLFCLADSDGHTTSISINFVGQDILLDVRPTRGAAPTRASTRVDHLLDLMAAFCAHCATPPHARRSDLYAFEYNGPPSRALSARAHLHTVS